MTTTSQPATVDRHHATARLSVLALQHVAADPFTPFEDIFTLAHLDNAYVRVAVAARLGLDADANGQGLLHELARDSDSGVRMAIVMRQQVPDYIVWMLVADEEPGIRTLARRRLGLPETLA